MTSLKGKVILVTGGAGGIGKAFVQTLLEEGCKVCIGDLNAENGNRVTEEFAAKFGEENVKFSLCDVTKDESFKGAFASCTESFGGVDILINNAGLGNEQNWKLVFDVNVGGAIRGTELALDAMSKAKGHNGGQVINLASISGLKVIPFGPFYSASKSAIVQYTRCVGHPFHFGYTGVSIQCLCPSLVDTPLLKSSCETPYNPQCAAAIKKLFGSHPLMQASEVCAALLKLINENKPGAVMVVEKDKDPYYVEPPIPS